MKLTPEEYQQMVKKASPPTKSYWNIPAAFVVGGLICVLGQIFTNWLVSRNIPIETASSSSSIFLIFLSALLTALNIYDNIAKYAGAGTLVPITGFANSVVSPAMEFKTEGYILGIGAKMFVIAGPVIVYGVAASILYGLIIYLFQLF